jgi:protein O-mannosyl-transferase
MSNRKKSFNKRDSHAWSGADVLSALPFGVLAGILLIIAAVSIAYFPSINGRFVFDDDVHLTENKFIKAADGPYKIWSTSESHDYWPITDTTYWIEWRLWGMHPAGYHVTNLILHVIGALLVWLILRRLSIPGAFLAALIFALHPVNVESEAWIASRKNLMAMLFFLLSIFWYIKANMPTASVGMAPARSRGEPWEREKTFSSFILHPSSFHFWYWLSLAAFLLAMLSKGTVAILPVLLLGIIWWLRPLTRQDLLLSVPFFLIALALAAVIICFPSRGVVEPFRTAGIIERLLGAGSVIWFYLYKALLPVDLAFIYPQWHIVTGNPLWWLPLSAALVVTAVLWRYRKGWSRPFLFAWGFFCVALLPVMGFTDVGFMKYSLVADRYQHIPLIGIIALASASWSAWHLHLRGSLRWLTPAVAVAAVGILGFLSWRQSGLYHDAFTLYYAILDKNPNCWMAYNNLSTEYVEIGQPQEAIIHSRLALKLKSDNPEIRNNFGTALNKAGRPQEAVEQYRQAIRLNPDYTDAYNNLGNALIAVGRSQEAIEYCKQALLINPKSLEAHNNLGNAFQSIGQYQQATDYYKTAINLNPNFFQAYINLGSALNKTGRIPEAIENYEKALRINPDSFEAHNNLGNALQSIGQYRQAIEHYQTALGLNPNFAQVHVNMGNALAKSGRLSQAIVHYRRAMELDPNSTTVYLYLPPTLAANHQSSEALDIAQKGLELARSKGEADLARRIEDWLSSYRASLTEH